MLKILWLSYFVFELVFCVGFVATFGFLNYMAEVLISSILGIILVSKVGISTIFQNAIFSNFKDIFGKFALLFAGIFLIIPGILSDVVGIVLLIFSIFTKSGKKTDKNKDDYIDVQIVEEVIK